MKILLMGGPGSGKGTQAKILKDMYNIAHISTGDILRAERANGTELGVLAQSYMDKGELVPDGVIIDMVKNRVAQPDCSGGYILDGFPRTTAQAEAMQIGGIDIDIAILLEVPDEIMSFRMKGRAEKEGRSDDADPAIIANRIATYHEQTAQVKKVYEALGKLAVVDGSVSPEATLEQVQPLLDAL